MEENKPKQKVLITGGAGFIGVNLVKYLLERTDWSLVVLDNLSAGSLRDLEAIIEPFRERVVFLEGDIREKEEVARAIQECTLVVSLAAQTGIIPSQKNPLEDAQNNILGLINLLEAARQEKVEKFIQASSTAPLGNQEMPINEDKIPRPLSPYGASKLSGEGYCSAFSESFGLNTVVLRFSNVYGPYSRLKKSDVVPLFVRRVLANKAVTIYGDGQQTRDFIYVRDICEAIYLSLTKKFFGNFQLFQLGTGQETSVNDLFKVIKEEITKRGKEIREPVYEPERKGEIRENYTDISKAKRVLSFSPKLNLQEGVDRTIDWLEENID